jgi:hypothetical protein
MRRRRASTIRFNVFEGSVIRHAAMARPSSHRQSARLTSSAPLESQCCCTDRSLSSPSAP